MKTPMNCKIESQDKERSGILKIKEFYLEKYLILKKTG